MNLRTSTCAVFAVVAALVGVISPATGRQPPDPVTISAKASKPAVAPGDQLAIAVVMEFEPGWHVHTNDPKPPAGVKAEDLHPTTIQLAESHLTAWPIQWPRPTNIQQAVPGTNRTEPYGVFLGRAVAFIPIQVPPNAAIGSTLSIPVNVRYQTCNEITCLPDDDKDVSVELRIVAPPAPGPVAPDADFAAFDTSAFQGAPMGPVQPKVPPSVAAGPPADPVFDLFGIRFSSGSLIVILLIAALGGFILNLTPCVLPVIPLKVMALQQSAGHHPRRRVLLGLSMSLGVVAFWLALGLLIVSFKVFRATNDLFGNPYFLLGVGAFVVAMALGMLGAFVIRLPQKLYMLNPNHESIQGSFGFGIMTAILGTPCFGPFAGAAAGWATTQPATVGILAFAAIGVGMAVPYVVLALWPGLLGFVPRTGPASELVKQIMGLLLLAAGVFFTGIGLLDLVAEIPYLSTVLHWWGVALCCLMAGAWLAWRTVRITKSGFKRVAFSAIGLAIAAIAIGWAQWQTSIARATYGGIWKAYSPESFEAARHDGKVTVLDFTADWCINCKIIEAAVLNRADVKTALAADGVVAFKVDITSRKALGRAKLAELNEVGIPLLAIDGPGLKDTWKSNAYGPAQVIDTIQQARGSTARTNTGPGPASR